MKDKYQKKKTTQQPKLVLGTTFALGLTNLKTKENKQRMEANRFPHKARF